MRNVEDVVMVMMTMNMMMRRTEALCDLGIEVLTVVTGCGYIEVGMSKGDYLKMKLTVVWNHRVQILNFGHLNRVGELQFQTWNLATVFFHLG